MVKIQVTFDLSSCLPACGDNELEEWLKYELGQVASMCKTNPMYDLDIAADNVSIKLINVGD